MTSRPVLMVHGAWHGPWCWDDWRRRLVAAGLDAHAMALPGHDRPGTRRRIWHRLGDYVAAVEDELDRLGPDTVVVAHSMGGLVTQRALESRAAALAVLVASVPRRGVLGASIRTARDIPLEFGLVNATASMYPIVANPELTRRAFFAESAPQAVVEDCHRHLQNESYPAYLQMLWTFSRPDRVGAPVRMIAGSDDRIFTVAEQRRLAHAYGIEPVVMDGCGHDVMLDPAGGAAVDVILGWIGELEG